MKIMKRLLGAVLFAIILSGASAARAQDDGSVAGVEETTPATAAAPQVESVPDWLKYKPAYQGEENNVANPHRTTDEITAWAQQAAADVLSFNKENLNARMESFKKYFVKQGWLLYISYLKDNKVIDMVNQQGYSVSTIVSQVPEIVNRGASGGVYHWILRMPITVSFFKKDPATGEPKQGPSGKFYLFLDVSRVAIGGGDDGIDITNWRVMEVPKN